MGGNSAKAGIKPGDTIIYTSSWFGDELWPADSPQFVNTALARAPSPVYITYVKGDNVDIPVKRLPKKPAPARFGRRLTAAQKERATHICVDCGYIYCDPLPFEETDPDYRCPQCQAPKKRFAMFDPNTGTLLLLPALWSQLHIHLFAAAIHAVVVQVSSCLVCGSALAWPFQCTQLSMLGFQRLPGVSSR